MSFSFSASGSACPCVLEVADGVGVERAGGGGRAQQRAAEARALFVGPVDQLQRDLRRLALVAPQDLDRRQQPEAPVQPAAVRHRVDVRSDDDDLVLAPAIVAHRLPAASRSTVASVSSSFLSSHSRAARQSSLHASRRAPSGPSRQLREFMQVLERTLPVEIGHARDNWRNSRAVWGSCSHDSLDAHHRALTGAFALVSGAPTPPPATGRPWSSAATRTCARRSSRARCVVQEGAEDADALHASGVDAGRAEVAQGRGPGLQRVGDRAGELGKYTYDKTVQDLLAPASYRAVVDFRWRDGRGRRSGPSGRSPRSAGSRTRGPTS